LFYGAARSPSVMMSVMPRYFTTVFFDWGGVIARDPGDDFLHELLLKIGARPEQILEIMQTLMPRFMCGQITEAEYWQGLRDMYGLRIYDTISREFQAWKGLKADAAILKLVDDIRASGIQVALLTNMIEPTYNVVEQAGYFHHFDCIIASCKVGFAKPDTAVYERALTMTHASANESVLVDDKQKNLDPAREMGLATILAKDTEQIVREMRALLTTATSRS